MAGKKQHVVPHGDDWAVRGAGNVRVTSVHPTQAEAEWAARDLAKNQRSEGVIHRPDGRFTRQELLRERRFPAERITGDAGHFRV